MDNRVYYGEYTLKHWIDLILLKNIELPSYQRHFVWKERDVKRLIKSLKEKQFVQPVTIALDIVTGKQKNLLLDGQQRLTSILLAYLGYFPKVDEFLKAETDVMANEDDSAIDDSVLEQNSQLDNVSEQRIPILWTFSKLVELSCNKDDIVRYISTSSKYEKLEDPEFKNLTEDFFENTYIGFSYIVPNTKDINEVQNTFSKLFRNINYFGKKLDALESRKSLYFQKTDLVNYFEGKCEDDSDVLCGLKIAENKIDFVRYMAILSQYKSQRSVMVGYSAYKDRESFYADYVSYVLGQGKEEQEDRPDKFDNFKFNEVFPNDCWKSRFLVLKQSIDRLSVYMKDEGKQSFKSWVEADYWLFGLIYHIVFQGKHLNESLERVNRSGVYCSLSEEINSEINAKKKLDYYKNRVNLLGYIRERLVKSCQIFSNYVS